MSTKITFPLGAHSLPKGKVHAVNGCAHQGARSEYPVRYPSGTVLPESLCCSHCVKVLRRDEAAAAAVAAVKLAARKEAEAAVVAAFAALKLVVVAAPAPVKPVVAKAVAARRNTAAETKLYFAPRGKFHVSCCPYTPDEYSRCVIADLDYSSRKELYGQLCHKCVTLDYFCRLASELTFDDDC